MLTDEKIQQNNKVEICHADDILSFTTLDCSSIGRLTELSSAYPYLLSCYSPGYLHMWSDYFNAAFAVSGDCVIIKVRTRNKERFFFPYPVPGAASPDIQAALQAIERYTAKKSIPLSFYVVPRNMLPHIALRYNSFTVKTDRSLSDYIYSAEDMRTFAGRRFSGQRNHLNKFKKLYPDARFRRLSDSQEDRALLERFFDKYESEFDSSLFSAQIELKLAREVFNKPCQPSDCKACVELDGEIISFCYGERVGNMLVIHIEKSLANYPGVYQFMVSSFAAEFSEGLEYINREDDASSRGLRISKTQYHPIKIEDYITVEVHNELHSMRHPPEIKTERLTLGLLSEQDTDEHRRLCLDDDTNKYWGYDYKADLPQTYAQNIPDSIPRDYFLRDAIYDYKHKISLTLAVRLDGKFIGEAVLNEFDCRGGANAGIRLLPEFGGRGYGKEAFEALCNYALYNIGLSYVTAYCYKENLSSLRMLSSIMNKTAEDSKYCYFMKNT